MNHDADDECTCDVGPFATCPVCAEVKIRSDRYEQQARDDEARRERERLKRVREQYTLTPLDIWNYAKQGNK
jgi:hypothetical protein